MRCQRFGVCCVLVALALLSACSTQHLGWTGKNLIRGTFDALLGFPAATLASGAGDALAASNDREHEENVEELNDAYAEFVRTRDYASSEALEEPPAHELEPAGFQ